MKRLKLEQGKEELISTGGNYLCGHILRELAREQLPEGFQSRREGAISDRDVLLTMTGLLCNGRSDFTNVNQYFEDTVFTQSFGIENLPSESTLRQRLDELPQARSHLALRQLNESALKVRSFGAVRAGELDLIPVDIDVSPLDNSGSHKQGVSFTYKKHDGYALIFAYIGTEGYMLNHELRPGKQHCQEGTPKFIGSCVQTLDKLKVIERLTDPDGNLLLLPQIEVNTYWTNLPCTAQDVVELYHDHGTSEQFHSELKSDLGVEQLPSGKFCVNQIVMLCAMLAFNTLRTIGQEVIARAPLAPIKIKVQRWRLKTVLQNIVYCAVRVIRHAREIKLHFGKNCLWYEIIEDIARSPSRT